MSMLVGPRYRLWGSAYLYSILRQPAATSRPKNMLCGVCMPTSSDLSKDMCGTPAHGHMTGMAAAAGARWSSRQGDVRIAMLILVGEASCICRHQEQTGSVYLWQPIVSDGWPGDDEPEGQIGVLELHPALKVQGTSACIC